MSVDDLGLCPQCGSDAIDYEEREGPTGVVAPDGGQERQCETRMICRACGEWWQPRLGVPLDALAALRVNLRELAKR